MLAFPRSSCSAVRERSQPPWHDRGTLSANPCSPMQTAQQCRLVVSLAYL
jgi:hypothetical protein